MVPASTHAIPAAWTHDLAARLEELTHLLHEEEQRWVQLTEQLESLSEAP